MKLRGSWYVLFAAMMWGTNGTAQALAPEGAQPVIIGTLRLVVGGFALLAVALARGVLRDGKRWPLWPTLIAALSMIAYQLFFFAGVARTGVAIGTIVGIGSTPIIAGVIGYLVRAERPGRVWGMATFLAIIGCALLIMESGDIHVDILGLILATGAGGSYAVFATVSKGLLEEHSPDAVMAVTFALGAVLISPLLFTADLGWLTTPRGVAVSLHLGLVSVALGYTLFARGLQLVNVATAATLTLAEPLTAGTLGVVVLGEPLTPPAAVGIALIFLGLALLSFQRPQPST